MTKPLPTGTVQVRNLNLWAHVGVLEKEQLHGQKFTLDFSLWLNLDEAARNDDIYSTCDYSTAIREIQTFSFKIRCQTMERFTEQILDKLEELYGKIPMTAVLRKCNPPINGFTGDVAIERRRNHE